jgi:uncharacterized RDD family membrane protein YckC
MNAPSTGTGWAAGSIEWQPPPTMRFAGVVLRALAFLVDLVLLSAYWTALLLGPTRALNGPILAVLLVAGPLLYFPHAWGRYGTTVGMRLFRLRIVRGSDGARIGYRTAVLRFAALLVSGIASIVIVGLVLLALPMVADQRRRGIHDRIADTVVVRPA